MAKKRFVLASDTHGDCIHRVAEKKFFDFCDDYKPQIRIHLGDWLEARCLRVGASAEDQAESMTEDWQSAQDFLARFKPQHALIGNHDVRVFEKQYVQDARVSSMAKMMVAEIEKFFAKIKATLHPYSVLHVKNEPLMLGKYRLVHGFRSSKHCAYQLAMTHGHAIMGHLHRYEVSTTDRSDGARGICCPALMDPKLAAYTHKREGMYRWSCGWLWGVVDTITGEIKINVEEVW